MARRSSSLDDSWAGPAATVHAILGALLGVGVLLAVWGIAFVLTKPSGSTFWYDRITGSLVINLFSFAAFAAAGMMLCSRRAWIRSQQKAFELDLISGDDERLVLPDDALRCRRRVNDLDASSRNSVLVRILAAALQRARANWSAEEVSAAVQSQTSLMQDRIDAQYATIRYLAWAIPPIGFIGTVLGIGRAMGALKTTTAEGGPDPTEIAAGHLHTAFDTTFVALVLSVILMFFFYRIQARDEMLIVRAADWCMQRLVYRMHIPKEEQP